MVKFVIFIFLLIFILNNHEDLLILSKSRVFHIKCQKYFFRFEDIIESEAAQKAEQNLVLNGQKLSVQFAFGDRKSKISRTKTQL